MAACLFHGLLTIGVTCDLPVCSAVPQAPGPLRLAATAACVVALSAVVGSLPADFEFVSQLAGAPDDISTSEETRMNGYPPYVLKTWCFVFFPGLLLPGLATLAGPLIATLPVLIAADGHRADEVSDKHWDELITDLRKSPDPLERKSLYMGRVAHDGSPLLVPRETFCEHAHFLGDSGAGKTSLGLAPLLEQLGSSGDCSIIVVDLKADSMELLAHTQQCG